MSKNPDQDRINALYNELKNKGERNTESATPNTHGYRPSPPISDDEVIRLCRNAENAAKFASFFDDGDTSEYAGDESDADFGLLGILKFYTQDPEQLDRLMRRSALKREKWDEPRVGGRRGPNTR